MSDLRAHLMKVRDDNGGQLTPDAVVEAAKPKSHPLHSRFEWDDRVAGAAHRRNQARALISSVQITFRDQEGGERKVREFHAVRSADIPQPVYDPVAEILDDEIATRILLADMRRDWQRLFARYEAFDEFRKMVLGDLGQETG